MNKPDSERLRVLWGSFAEAFHAEAAVLGVAHRRFSIPKFMHLLVSQPENMHANLSIFLKTTPNCVGGNLLPLTSNGMASQAVEESCTGGPGTANAGDHPR